jgi:sterol 3beta-glucosyltransferase
MKILLISIGTRGDVEPFLSLAEILKDDGHEFVGAFPEQFRELTEAAGIRFQSLGAEFLDLLDTKAGRLAMGGDGGRWRKFGSLVSLARQSMPIQRAMTARQHQITLEEEPDLILHNGKATFPLLWSLSNPTRAIHISAVPYLVHEVTDHPHIGMGNSNLGSFLNRLTYKLANFGLIQTIKSTAKWLKLPDRATTASIKRALNEEKMVYCVSPSLFPRPDYWPNHVHVLGYQERNKVLDWQPSEDLKAFLGRHDQCLLVTFGSMSNQHPIEKTAMFLETLEAQGIPAVFNTAAGGLVEPETYNRDLFHFVDQIPYDWAFERVHTVIHHGGSGTTHMALRKGCASMIIPHIIDQFLWNDVVHKLGAGPKGQSIGKVNRDRLARDIKDLWNNPSYKAQAEQISVHMKTEDFTQQLRQLIGKSP